MEPGGLQEWMDWDGPCILKHDTLGRGWVMPDLKDVLEILARHKQELRERYGVVYQSILNEAVPV